MINLVGNLKNSLRGFSAALTDRSFRAELLMGIVLIPLTAVSSSNPTLKLVIVATYLLLLAIELLNTALERLCDLITLDYNPAIKCVKDMASGAVLLVLIVFLFEVFMALTGFPEL